MPNRSDILKAMEQFDLHGPPSGFELSRTLFLVHPETQMLYPPKAIWGWATGRKNDFYSRDAVKRLRKLGFDVHDIAKENLSDRRFPPNSYPKHPEERLELVRRYIRNPYVIEERLKIANGICEDCKKSAPFDRAADGTPFLEVHHVVFLTDGGEDTVENTRALCPNCHRKAHYG